jgi:putative transposase
LKKYLVSTTNDSQTSALINARILTFQTPEDSLSPAPVEKVGLALDVFTRMVSGFYLTMEAPSRLSTSLCLLHAVFDKTACLQECEIEEAWPMAGLTEFLHVDNGADFRSRAFDALAETKASRSSGVRRTNRTSEGTSSA